MTDIIKIDIRTENYFEFIDITAEIKKSVRSSTKESGIAIVFTPHTTSGVTINENADPSVKSDITNFLMKNYTRESYFRHLEGNSPSHILSSIFSPSLTLIIDKGEIVLGTWQGIFFCEFDGPRERKIFIKIIEG